MLFQVLIGSSEQPELNITYGINRSFLSEAKEIWETEVQRGFLLMPVRRPEP